MTNREFGLPVVEPSTMASERFTSDTTNNKIYFTNPNLYEKARPEYSQESVKFLLEKLGVFSVASNQPFAILEIGTGTGKFTRVMREVLVNRNVTITASDSNPKMCEAFRDLVPDVEIMLYPAEKIDTADESFDAVIAAQSFHWFANEDSVSEIYRVLKPGGLFGCIWNNRDLSTPWVKEVQELLEPFYKREKTPDHRDNEWKKKIDKCGNFGEIHFDNNFRISLEGRADTIVGVYMGISAVAAASDAEKEILVSKIRHILATHDSLKDKEICTLPYITDISWCVKNKTRVS